MSASAEASRKIFVRAGRSHGRTRSRGCRTRDSRRWEDGREKRRAWVQGGLGTSATRHARRLMGSRSSSRSAAGHAARATCFFELDLAFRRRAFVTHGRDLLGKGEKQVLETRPAARQADGKAGSGRAAPVKGARVANQHLALSQNAIMISGKDARQSMKMTCTSFPGLVCGYSGRRAGTVRMRSERCPPGTRSRRRLSGRTLPGSSRRLVRRIRLATA